MVNNPMKVQLEHILQNLFHASALPGISADSLQEMVKEHPYFSTAHFLLSQKLKQENPENMKRRRKRPLFTFTTRFGCTGN